MTLYRTRARTVHAEQFNPDVEPYPFGISSPFDSHRGKVFLFGNGNHYEIVLPGDWVIEDDGERRIVRREVFAALYEGVDV
jgi:hypothetical protein